MRVPTVIRVTVGAGGAVHGLEVSEERTHLFNGWDVITCPFGFLLPPRTQFGPDPEQGEACGRCS
jgi:hypothetical protein